MTLPVKSVFPPSQVEQVWPFQALCAVISIPEQCFQQNTFSQDTTAFTDDFHDPLTEGFYKQDQNAS